MCDVIYIRLKRRIEMRIGKGNQLLNIKTALKKPILKLKLLNFILLFVASIPFRRILMTSHMTLSSASPISIQTRMTTFIKRSTRNKMII